MIRRVLRALAARASKCKGCGGGASWICISCGGTFCERSGCPRVRDWHPAELPL